jgi:hypothetical protein
MAKNIQGMHDFLNLLYRKGLTGYFPPLEIDVAIYNASKDLYLVEDRKYELTQELTDTFAVFKSTPLPLTIPSNGQYPYPDDYNHLIGMLCSTSLNGIVQEIDEGMIGLKLANPLTPPTLQYPCCVLENDYIQFYPNSSITGVTMTYLKYPIQPVYAYTIVNGRYVYNDSASVDVEWRITDINKVTIRALEYLGITLSDQVLAAFGDSIQKKNE